MPRVALEPGYVLHVRPYSESSSLLEIFSRSHGRVGLVARGARGARSRFKGVLQPFRPLLLSWNQKTELGTLTGADQVASPPALAGEPLFCGLYANELLMRFLQRADPHPELFDGYRELLGGLSAGMATQGLLRLFERRLLAAAGFGLQLDCEHGSGRPLRPDGRYRYLPDLGPVPGGSAEDDGEQLVSGAALLALKSGSIPDCHLAELKALMRRVIAHYLGDRPIRSHQLFS